MHRRVACLQAESCDVVNRALQQEDIGKCVRRDRPNDLRLNSRFGPRRSMASLDAALSPVTLRPKASVLSSLRVSMRMIQRRAYLLNLPIIKTLGEAKGPPRMSFLSDGRFLPDAGNANGVSSSSPRLALLRRANLGEGSAKNGSTPTGLHPGARFGLVDQTPLALPKASVPRVTNNASLPRPLVGVDSICGRNSSSNSSRW